MNKHCTACNQDKKVTGFYRNRNRPDGRQDWCNCCMLNQQVAWRKTKSGRLSIARTDQKRAKQKREYAQKYRQLPRVKRYQARKQRLYSKDPVLRIRYLARWLFKRYKRTGKIPVLPCVNCGAVKAEGHHPDYSKPLLIVWLCKKCHREEHYLIKSVKGEK